jgi:hypothetical protein
MSPRWILVLFVWLVAGGVRAAPLAVADVPEPLKPWVPWVLRDATQLQCPYVHASSELRRCAWPSRLELTLTDVRGEFVQEWVVYEPTWVPLPGDDKRWPQEVKLTPRVTAEPIVVAGKPVAAPLPAEALAVVQARNGMPGLELAPGSYRVTGAFQWDSLPEKLQVPGETGLLALKVRGEAVAFPQRDNAGVLWLQKRAPEGSEENLLNVVVHRKIVDSIPLVVTTQVEIHASGKNREVLLGKALLADFVPMQVRSELPARLEADGRLRVQIRPGAWTIAIDARHPGSVQQLTLGASEGQWAAEEIWAFAGEPTLRRVEIDGVTAVDPQQTLLPEDWKRLQTFRVRPTEAMLLIETHRGEVDRGPDQLTLSRQWWLDFDGQGVSIRDQLRGEVHDTKRLEVQPPAQLGYAESQGTPLFITSLTATDHPGVELRSTNLDLRSDMRVLVGGLEKVLSAVDWDQDFARVEGVLHLPPGWRLLHAVGVDEVDDTWLQRWTLLDIFLVLVISIAIGRLYGWAWGTLAVITLALVFPEWMAPRTVWVFVLISEAIHRVLPAGRVHALMRGVRLLALLSLTGIVLVFAVQQIRGGLYPALAVRSDDDNFGRMAFDDRAAPTAAFAEAPDQAAYGGEKQGRRGRLELAAKEEPWANDGEFAAQAPQGGIEAEKNFDDDGRQQADVSGSKGYAITVDSAQSLQRKQQKLREYDLNTVVQTGSGLPSWRWRSVALRWNGPVTRDQKVRLFLIPPQFNLGLAFIRVLFLVTLLLAVFGVWSRRRGRTAAGTLAAALIVGGGLLAPATASAQVPDASVLSELRARLTEAPTCLPSCVTSPRLRLEVAATGLRVVQEVHVAAPVAVPLPGNGEQWLPTSVLVDGAAASGVVRTPDGALTVELRAGRHEVVLEGPLPARETVQIALPIKPHRVEAKATGWTVDGLHEDGLADDNLQLTRMSPQDGSAKAAELEVGTLPPFVRLERSLQLGLTWELTTRVTRSTPQGAAVVLGVPLLPGESVTTADLRVEGGEVLVNMAPDASSLEWTSLLPISPTITLAAAIGEPWSEVWQVEVGPVWHIEHQGLPTVRQGEGGLREWRPWPGEQVVLTITRPEGVPGQTLTIDRALLALDPGLRAVDARLRLDLRSSRGGHHVLQIPAAALLQGVTIDGQKQTIGQEGPAVRVPVEPGAQTIELSWRETHALGTRYVAPVVDLGAPAVNVEVHTQFPANRWILFVDGPRLGPAVLFWSFVIMLLIAAGVLSRLRWSPLKGHQWFLLGIGLSTLEMPAVMLVAGWFLALAWRRDHANVPGWWFDLRQLMLLGWTLIACVCLEEAIRMGLLGQPDMQIMGNDSYGSSLKWFQDRIDGQVPRPWVLSVSMWWYRGLMLAWALWLAWSLIRWVPWAWQSFGAGGLWRSVNPSPRPPGGPGSSAAGSRGALATTHQQVQAHTSSASEAIFSTRGDSIGGMDSPPPTKRRGGASDTLPGANPRMADTEIQKPARLADTEIQKPAARLADTEIQKPKASARVVAQGALPQPDAHTKPRQPPPPHAGGLPTRRGTKGAEPEEMMPDDDEGL